ncbi:PHO85 cyclin-9, partial [Diaporthe amygdali]|uniref:PHO85 cyclin-9 n=1 Tax=Phomopsis amygdali TaxID=1214568 RepID=UPI0022FEE80D
GVGFLPSLENFIEQLINTSGVDRLTLVSTLIYLKRVKSRLRPGSRGYRCTAHRLFFAALILSDKYSNDESRMNKDWAPLSLMYFEGELIFGFSLAEVKLLEKQLLQLLDYDVGITEDDWLGELEVFEASVDEE